MKKLFIFFIIITALTSCSRGITQAQMEKELSNFELPSKPSSGKALVYFVYRNDIPTIIDIMNKNNNSTSAVELFYTTSTPEKVSRDNSKAFKIVNVFALGALNEKISEEKISIGKLIPGHYKIKSFKPGYYEINRTMLVKNPLIAEKEKAIHLDLEADKTYFIWIKADSFFNRYSGQVVHDIYMNDEKDDIKGKYMLSKNFKEQK